MATHLNIIVVEDNDDLRETIVELLVTLGHRVLGLSCAEHLGDEGAQAQIDLLVVDLNLPGEDGVSLSRRLRSIQPGLRILMMTARDTVRDKVAGYEAGADIYLTKPVSVEELSAAVQSLGLRLRADQALPESQAQLSLQVEGLRAQGPLGSIELSAVEVALLTALARAPGQRLAYWQLFAIINPGSEAATLSNLAVRMTRLRKKLTDVGVSGPTLQVVRHEGYQLCLPVKLL